MGGGCLNKWEGRGLKGTVYDTYPLMSAAGLQQTGENCSLVQYLRMSKISMITIIASFAR